MKMRMSMLAALAGVCGGTTWAGEFVPVSQTRNVHTHVRAVNSLILVEQTDTDDDAAPGFGAFNADIASKATAGTMHTTSVAKQNTEIDAHSITGSGIIRGTYTAVPGGACLYEYEGRSACTIVFNLTASSHIDFESILINPVFTSEMFVTLRGPTGFLATAFPPPLGTGTAAFHGTLPPGQYRIDAQHAYEDPAYAPNHSSSGTEQGWTFTLTTPPPPSCDGDANGDNQIDGADLSVLLANFGSAASGPGQGDFNGDNACNGADLSVLLANFGESC